MPRRPPPGRLRQPLGLVRRSWLDYPVPQLRQGPADARRPPRHCRSGPLCRWRRRAGRGREHPGMADFILGLAAGALLWSALAAAVVWLTLR